MKMYLNAIAYEDPLKVLQQVEDLNTIMLRQLKQGNRSALQQLYYGSLLSRVATQTASAASGIAQLVALPLGQIGSGVVRRNAPDVFEGIGQLVGGIQQINSALEVGIRSWNANRSLMGGNKIAQGVGNLQVRQKQLDALYEGAKNASYRINYGNCTKLNKEVSFIPNHCQLHTQECFEHRRG